MLKNYCRYELWASLQPDGLAQDSTWLVELNKFLDGKENSLKEHPKYLKYEYEFVEKPFPSVEMANDLINKQWSKCKSKG